ncbi:MAG: GNAT family N-acetyltransferase [Ktedonobacterales bacterium]|jgi:RimJ/RimL family protein N-acetyltransferase
MSDDVSLRPVEDSDLSIFFEQEQDPDARHMAAFTTADPTNRTAFLAHWKRVRSDDTMAPRTIIWDGQVAGHLGSWIEAEGGADPTRELGYWLGKPFWGKGIATRALTLFLRELPMRPLYAHAAKDNLGSIRVLEKCGFIIIGEDMYYAHARGAEIPEVRLRLDAASPA